MRILWCVVGSVSFLLGFFGILLPLLPTTPFWLLTAICYMKGSARLYDKVMSVSAFRRIVENFRINRAIPLKIKAIAVSSLWITISVSCYVVDRWWIVILLLAVASGVTWHILSYKTLRDTD